jgi:glycerol-3-phosphate acyltransferase PlsY
MEWLLVLVGYLVGAFPTAYVFGRRIAHRDIRELGDRNMGARNAYFEIGHRAGVFIFVIDVLKGAIPVLLCQLFEVTQPVLLWTGIAAVAGHNFPVFLGFRGGRGEATTIGILIVVLPVPSLIMLPIALAALIVVKNVIAASAVLFIGMAIVNWVRHEPGLLLAYAILLPIIVALTHFLRTRHPSSTAGTGSA